MPPWNLPVAAPGEPEGVPVIGRTGLKGMTAYGPWQPRLSNRALFACEVIARTSNATLDITIEHKHPADIDSAATNAGSFTQITGPGLATKDISGLKGLWRCKFVFGESGSTSEARWSHFRMLGPFWSSIV